MFKFLLYATLPGEVKHSKVDAFLDCVDWIFDAISL